MENNDQPTLVTGRLFKRALFSTHACVEYMCRAMCSNNAAHKLRARAYFMSGDMSARKSSVIQTVIYATGANKYAISNTRRISKSPLRLAGTNLRMPFECLSITLPNDEERPKHFLTNLENPAPKGKKPGKARIMLE